MKQVAGLGCSAGLPSGQPLGPQPTSRLSPRDWSAGSNVGSQPFEGRGTWDLFVHRRRCPATEPRERRFLGVGDSNRSKAERSSERLRAGDPGRRMCASLVGTCSATCPKCAISRGRNDMVRGSHIHKRMTHIYIYIYIDAHTFPGIRVVGSKAPQSLGVVVSFRQTICRIRFGSLEGSVPIPTDQEWFALRHMAGLP